MKKIVLFSLCFSVLVGSPIVGYAEVLEAQEVQRAAYIPFDFISYPPKTYRGMVLVRVDKKKKGGYVGWYV
ncbi:hypothetical protein ACYSNO_08490 [Enterococcus sp. LJL98]